SRAGGMSKVQATVDRGGVAAEPSRAQPGLLLFFSPTSGASRRVDAFLAQVLQRRANHSTFRLLRIDADRRPDLVERLQITELPTVVVVADERVRARLSKPTGCAQITKLLLP